MTSPTIPLPPGVTFRPWRHPDDYAAMAAVRAAYAAATGLDRHSPETMLPTTAELAHRFDPHANPHLGQTLLLVEAAGVVIGYHTIHWWTHRAGISYMQRGYLMPLWWNQGIGTCMLQWAEAAIGRMAAPHPPTTPKQLRSFLTTAEGAAHTLLVAQGYDAYAPMIELVHAGSTPPVPALPPGLRSEPARADQYRAIWEANEQVFRDEPERSPPTEAGYQEFLADADPSLWQVIWDGQAVAGVALCEITRLGVGVISQLSVGERWRRQSLGTALVVQALAGLRAHGVAEVRVVTEADNAFGAQRLYEGVGFRRGQAYCHYRKPLRIP